MADDDNAGLAFLIFGGGGALYYIYGGIFLARYYKYDTGCGDSYLWYYCLTSMISPYLAWNIHAWDEVILSDSCKCIISWLVSGSFSLWGAIEIFINADSCSQLMRTKLMTFAQVNFGVHLICTMALTLAANSQCHDSCKIWCTEYKKRRELAIKEKEEKKEKRKKEKEEEKRKKEKEAEELKKAEEEQERIFGPNALVTAVEIPQIATRASAPSELEMGFFVHPNATSQGTNKA